MLTPDQLKEILHSHDLSKTDAALLCLAAAGRSPAPIAAVRKAAIGAGMKGAKTLNFSAHLSATGGRAINTPGGWELTGSGQTHVASLAAQSLTSSPAAVQAKTLRALLPNIANSDSKAFLTEAIVCAESSLLRAAVVLSWVGAVALLQDHVVKFQLAKFNAEATKRNPKWKPASTADDISRMTEHDFLQVLEAISVIGKNVKQELEVCLKLRNGCGHPNSLKIGPNKVASHLETLGLNVFAVFG